MADITFPKAKAHLVFYWNCPNCNEVNDNKQVQNDTEPISNIIRFIDIIPEIATCKKCGKIAIINGVE